MKVGWRESSPGDARAGVTSKLWKVRQVELSLFYLHVMSARASPALDSREPTFIVYMRLSETQSFIIVFTTARQGSLSGARLLQSIYYINIPLRYILILSYHSCLSLQNGLILSGLSNHNVVCIPQLPHARYLPRPSHPL
jgi:hypothetical protein